MLNLILCCPQFVTFAFYSKSISKIAKLTFLFLE